LHSNFFLQGLKMKVNHYAGTFMEQLKGSLQYEQQLIQRRYERGRRAAVGGIEGAFEDTSRKNQATCPTHETSSSRWEKKPRERKYVGPWKGWSKEGGEVIKEDMEESIRIAALIDASNGGALRNCGLWLRACYATKQGTKTPEILLKPSTKRRKPTKTLNGIAEELT